MKHGSNKDSKIIVTVDKMEMSNLQTVPMATLREDTLQFQIINPAFFIISKYMYANKTIISEFKV